MLRALHQHCTRYPEEPTDPGPGQHSSAGCSPRGLLSTAGEVEAVPVPVQRSRQVGGGDLLKPRSLRAPAFRLGVLHFWTFQQPRPCSSWRNGPWEEHVDEGAGPDLSLTLIWPCPPCWDGVHQ